MPKTEGLGREILRLGEMLWTCRRAKAPQREAGVRVEGVEPTTPGLTGRFVLAVGGAEGALGRKRVYRAPPLSTRRMTVVTTLPQRARGGGSLTI